MHIPPRAVGLRRPLGFSAVNLDLLEGFEVEVPGEAVFGEGVAVAIA